MIKNGDIWDIGQTVNGVSRFLYLDGRWYYARSLVMRYNYDESELTKAVTLDDDETELIGNIFTDDMGLDFSQCDEVLQDIRNYKLNQLL
jgi:hypothetical protein